MNHNLSFRRAVLFLLLLTFLVVAGCFWKKKTLKKPPTARELYRQGINLEKKERYEEARKIFNKVKVMGTKSDLELLAQIAVADSYFEEKEYEAARTLYKEMFKLHSGGPVADYLLYRTGECHFWQIDTIDRDPTHAKEALKVFNRLLQDFPKSEYLAQARLRIKSIQTFLAENEFFIGEFYLRKNALFAAVNRFKEALDRYPDSGINDQLLFYLYKAYRDLKDEEHAEEYRKLLFEQYPNSEYIPSVRKLEQQGTKTSCVEKRAAECADRPLVSTGLAGTYQGKDRDARARRLLLLQARSSDDQCRATSGKTGSEEKEVLLKRSFLDKIIPW
ncbi:MAG: outer membrane protein assembly factor BamD [Deltaproteobacteria bacterium]|nr:outer membrane protein assembly factor BamD [Deltaproteobacteria bacterium]